LKDSQQQLLSPFIKSEQLTVHTLEEFKLPELIRNNRTLSPSDKSVFSLALELDAMILTGDGLIRRTAISRKIETHGSLWLLDRFLEKELITRAIAVQRLEKLRGYNTRLPHADCEDRISNWS
jgi:predicted nucleic acid-binding protein